MTEKCFEQQLDAQKVHGTLQNHQFGDLQALLLLWEPTLDNKKLLAILSLSFPWCFINFSLVYGVESEI